MKKCFRVFEALDKPMNIPLMLRITFSAVYIIKALYKVSGSFDKHDRPKFTITNALMEDVKRYIDDNPKISINKIAKVGKMKFLRMKIVRSKLQKIVRIHVFAKVKIVRIIKYSNANSLNHEIQQCK